MAASDHLGPQFFHGTIGHTFQPGDTLTPRGASVAKHGEEKVARYEQHGFGLPEKHVYYTDHSGLGEMGMYAHGDQGHIYAVRPETATGRAAKPSRDPNYRHLPEIGAYRTTGRLRVLHEVDQHGSKVGD